MRMRGGREKITPGEQHDNIFDVKEEGGGEREMERKERDRGRKLGERNGKRK